jgi:hypothetical protein
MREIMRLEMKRARQCIFIFSHGQFIQAVRHTVMFPEWTDTQKMEHFWPSPVLNGQKIEVELAAEGWRLIETQGTFADP